MALDTLGLENAMTMLLRRQALRDRILGRLAANAPDDPAYHLFDAMFETFLKAPQKLPPPSVVKRAAKPTPETWATIGGQARDIVRDIVGGQPSSEMSEETKAAIEEQARNIVKDIVSLKQEPGKEEQQPSDIAAQAKDIVGEIVSKGRERQVDDVFDEAEKKFKVAFVSGNEKNKMRDAVGQLLANGATTEDAAMLIRLFRYNLYDIAKQMSNPADRERILRKARQFVRTWQTIVR